MSWVKLHRQFVDWGWYTSPNMPHLFIHLLLKANVEEGYYQGELIKRGQCVIGRKSLSAQTGISEQTLRTCLDKLKSTHEITIESKIKFSIVTILNYEKYQDQPGQNLDNQPPTNQQLTTSKNKQTNKISRSRSKKNGVVRKSKAISADDLLRVEFPAIYDQPEVYKALEGWILYKKEEHGHVYKSTAPLKAILTKALKSKAEADLLVFAIETAIANQWKGIDFYPSVIESFNQQSTTPLGKKSTSLRADRKSTDYIEAMAALEGVV
jgi:hypothetical protein